ncbi:hypothetical protein KSC_091940 [Ktedonobacter sp. SOSP1-52]|nr:hypothetical protein KSC_091940 [Ktedonobacter sp. SOSP1-52]
MTILELSQLPLARNVVLVKAAHSMALNDTKRLVLVDPFCAYARVASGQVPHVVFLPYFYNEEHS